MTRRILVATDGTPAALGALRMARALGKAASAEVEIMGVAAPVPVFDAGFLLTVPEGDLYASRLETLETIIRRQVESVCGGPCPWAVRVDAGVPAPQIVKRADAIRADFIFMGLGEHKTLDRVFGTETALQVIRLSHLPVLAVPRDWEALPRSAALGIDFSPFSQRAISVAVDLMTPPWELHLAHVMAGMEFLPSMSDGWREEYEEEMRDRLGALIEGVPVPADSAIHLHVLEGDPSDQLLHFAEQKEVELVAAGSHGHSFLGRILIGSVSTRLVRGARTPVLVVPPRDPTREVFPESPREESQRSWAEVLKTFSDANAGRKTRLELSDPEAGLRECERGLRLLGVCHDPRKDRVEIMLGRTGTVEGHLTHSLSGPREITVERDSRGRPAALRIDLADGFAVLRVFRD